MLRSFRFPSNVGGDLNFILSGLGVDDDDAISGFFIDAVNIGEIFGGVNGTVKVGSGGKGIGSVLRDKVETISAAFLSSAACLVVGMCTSSIYIRVWIPFLLDQKDLLCLLLVQKMTLLSTVCDFLCR